MTDETPAPPPPPPGPAAPPQPGPYGGDEPWAARLGLVRPRHGRMVAGVCAGIGRATNTDPLLWRVLFGVLSVFGIGLALYLGAWLLTPAEGDTASPIEQLIGRGHSSTSTGLTVGLVVFTIVCIGALTDNWIAPVVAIVAIVVIALANPKGRNWNSAPARMPDADPATAPISPDLSPLTPVTQTGYQPPFAPHGPYASTAPPLPPLPPKPVRIKRERSRLGRFVIGLTLLFLGVLGFADLAGASVPASVYVATALLMVGIGLILGTWFGRARGLILIGIILSIATPIVADEELRDRTPSVAPQYWTPMSIDELNDSYDNRFGDLTLDLTNVDFTGQKKTIRAEVGGGRLRVLLPSNVDVVVNTNVKFGEADVFGQQINGVNVQDTRRDVGADGEGGGQLELQLVVRAGNAEVTR